MQKKQAIIYCCLSTLFLSNIATAEIISASATNQNAQQKQINSNFNQLGNQKKITVQANDSSADCSTVTHECLVNPPDTNSYSQEGNVWTQPQNQNFTLQVNQ